MTIYKIVEIVEQSTAVGDFVGGVTVHRRKVVAYLQEKEDAEQFVRCYLLSHPAAKVKQEEMEVAEKKRDAEESGEESTI